MNLLNCAPKEGWLPFSDPTTTPTEEEQLITKFSERALHHDSEFSLTAFEKSPSNLRWILQQCNDDLETATNKWLEWVKWRRAVQCESIYDESISPMLDSGIAIWRGRDKMKRPCCVVTGRLFDNDLAKPKSFQKFLIRIVEDGLKKLDRDNEEKRVRLQVMRDVDSNKAIDIDRMDRDAGAGVSIKQPDSSQPVKEEVIDQICILYDRRDMEGDNVSPTLYSMCRNTVAALQEYYGSRLGRVYVLHTNFLYWVLYHMIMKPLMSLYASGDKVVLVNEVKDLLKYFDEDQILLVSTTESSRSRRAALEKQQAAKASSEGNAVASTDAPKVAIATTQASMADRSASN